MSSYEFQAMCAGLDAVEGALYGTYRKPSWFDASLRPCSCGAGNQTVAAMREIVCAAEAPSDGCYRRIRCVVCGQEWCQYFEG